MRKKLALPMAQTSLASLQRGRNCRKRIVSSVFLRKYGVMRIHQLTTLDMAVAALAPATPQPNVKIKSGSSATLSTAPATMPVMEKTALPSARRHWLRTKLVAMNGAASRIYRQYCSEYGRMSSFAPSRRSIPS